MIPEQLFITLQIQILQRNNVIEVYNIIMSTNNTHINK